MAMSKKKLERFRRTLAQTKLDLLKKARDSLGEDMQREIDQLPDEMDAASSEYLQSFTIRLRGREKGYLAKIDRALEKIHDGSFGICESCEEPIDAARLEARPVTTLCIQCKEDQERREKSMAER
jgi:DnaK suppressor protein